MKKIVSILVSLSIASTLLLSACFSSSAADKITEKYYPEGTSVSSGTAALSTDSIDPSDIVSSSLDNAYDESGANEFKITSPCTVYAGFVCLNEDQVPVPFMPVPKSLDYEMMLSGKTDSTGTGWISGSYPDFINNQGDYEYAKYEITQSMIDDANGEFDLVWSVRSIKFPDNPFSDLGQVISSSYLHIYYMQDKITELDGSAEKSVTASFYSSSDTVYSADISWGSMEFTYTDASQGKWDPDTHEYVGATQAAWSCETDANKITVTNHSNAPVNITLTYASESGYTDITGAFEETSGTSNDGILSLATAEGTTTESAPSSSALLDLSGALSSDTSASTKLGTVTVTLSSVQ